MSVNELIDFIFENYHKQIGFPKKAVSYSMKHLKRKLFLFLLSTKLIEKIADSRNAKEQYQSLI